MTYIVLEYGRPHVNDCLPTFKPNALAVLDRTWKQIKVYDSEHCYTISPTSLPKYNVLSRGLIFFGYSPNSKLDYEWVESGVFSIDSVRNDISRGLEHDDDCIQQYFGANQIYKILDLAFDYESLCLSIRGICGEFQEDEEVAEHISSILGYN